MVVNLIMRVLPTKILCQSNRPAQVRDVRPADLFDAGQYRGQLRPYAAVPPRGCFVNGSLSGDPRRSLVGQ